MLNRGSVLGCVLLTGAIGCGGTPPAAAPEKDEDLVEATIVRLHEDGREDVISGSVPRTPAGRPRGADGERPAGALRQATTVDYSCPPEGMLLRDGQGSYICFLGRGTVRLADYDWDRRAFHDYRSGREGGRFTGITWTKGLRHWPYEAVYRLDDETFDAYQDGFVAEEAHRVETLVLGATAAPYVVSEMETGNTGWAPLPLSRGTMLPGAELRTGDVDGDGTTDLIYRTDNEVFVSTAAQGRWQRRGYAPQRSITAVGDFSGDGRADLLFAYVDGYFLFDMGSGTGEWIIHGAVAPIADLATGNFVGDSRTDVFWGDGARWYVSDAARGAWQPINSSISKASALSFADLDNDGYTDVFRTDGGQWKISRGGRGRWEVINTVPTATGLVFGNFVGDARADVLWSEAGTWRVSEGGTGSPRVLRTTPLTLANLVFGNFRGDAHTDALRLDPPITGP